MPSLLIISHDLVGPRMAGVGIRYTEIARALAAQGVSVTLVAPQPSERPLNFAPVPVRFETFKSLTEDQVREWIGSHDAVFAYPDTIWQCRQALDACNVPLVVDGYNITLFEHLEMDVAQPIEVRMRWHQDYQQMMNYVLQRGDFFVVGTERQRDFWLGMLAGANRVNALNHQRDASLKRLIDLVPYGIPDTPPMHTHSVIRGVLPGVRESDIVVLWGGGAWPWLDPVTLLKAAALICKQRDDFKFIFPGLSHPNTSSTEASIALHELHDLSIQLGLGEQDVFFLGWVPYDQWGCYLLESDIGVSLHHDHLESRFSLRTRVLSYIWAGLPMVLSRGDELAEAVAQTGAAQLIDPGDAKGTAEALLRCTEHKRRRYDVELRSVRTSLRWSAAVRALLDFCQSPQRAADRKADRIVKTRISVATESLEPLERTTSSAIQIPHATTSLARLLEPSLRALLLWYLESVVAQQNTVNDELSKRLQHVERATQDQQAHIAGLQAFVERATQDQQAHIAELQAHIAGLQAFVERATQDQQAHIAGLQAFVERATQDQQAHIQYALAAIRDLAEQGRHIESIVAVCQTLIGELQQARSIAQQKVDQLELRLHDLERLLMAVLKEFAEQRVRAQNDG